MAARRPGTTIRVPGPRGQQVGVKFFDNGSVSFRLNGAGPMVVRYAFLPGKGQNVVVELAPGPASPWSTSSPPSTG